MPDEDEHASSPPRSLSNQDIKSEHIPSRLNVHRFGKKNAEAQSVFPEELSDGISKEVHESVAPRMQAHLPPEAQVSARVALVETSRSVQTFKMTYDRLFRKFQEKLIEHYSGMRGGYMSEYQLNYDQNSSRRDNRLTEMNSAIDAQVNYARELERVHEQ